MTHAGLFEKANMIRNKTTKAGMPNPRYTTAVNEAKLNKKLLKDLAGTFKVFTKKEIAQQYPPERVEALLAAAQRNLQAMTGPSVRPGWLPEE